MILEIEENETVVSHDLSRGARRAIAHGRGVLYSGTVIVVLLVGKGLILDLLIRLSEPQKCKFPTFCVEW